MTYPWPTLMSMGIVVISCVRPSVHPFMGLGLCIAYKALGRNGLQFGMLMYPDGLHLGFFWVFLLFFFFFFPKVRVGAKEGGSHYWEMAVAITCGYGGYLLPLLAAHSSYLNQSESLNGFVSLAWRRIGAKSEGGSREEEERGGRAEDPYWARTGNGGGSDWGR